MVLSSAFFLNIVLLHDIDHVLLNLMTLPAFCLHNALVVSLRDMLSICTCVHCIV